LRKQATVNDYQVATHLAHKTVNGFTDEQSVQRPNHSSIDLKDKVNSRDIEQKYLNFIAEFVII
jgi:hypothetical protein